MKVNFHIGKRKSTLRDIIIISACLAFIVSFLSDISKIEEKKVWCFVDEVTRFLNSESIEEVKLKILEIRLCRAQKAVDSGISDFKNNYEIITGKKWKPVEIVPPLYSEQDTDEKVCYTDDCKALGGSIRLCSQWVEGCEGTPVEYEELENLIFKFDKPTKNMVEFFRF